MNYKKIYFQIIRNRINNPLSSEQYGEFHHIKPKSFGGMDDKKNLVRLSAREHFIVHFLLYKHYKNRSKNIFPNSQKEAERYRKMAYALHLMLQLSSLKASAYTLCTSWLICCVQHFIIMVTDYLNLILLTIQLGLKNIHVNKFNKCFNFIWIIIPTRINWIY